MVPFSAEYRNILNDYLLRIASASMRDVTLVILNSLRIKCHIRRPLTHFALINRAEFYKNVLMGGKQVPSDATSVTGF